MIMSIVDHVVVIDSSWISLRSSSSREGLPHERTSYPSEECIVPRQRNQLAFQRFQRTRLRMADRTQAEVNRVRLRRSRMSRIVLWFMVHLGGSGHHKEVLLMKEMHGKKTITIGRRKSAEMTDSATGESCFLFFPGRMRVTQCGDAGCRGCAQIDWD